MLLVDSTNNFYGSALFGSESSTTPAATLESFNNSATQLRLTRTLGSVFSDVFTDVNGWLNFSPTGSHAICNGRLGGSDVLLNWASAGYGGSVGVSNGDYSGPRTLMEIFYSLSSAPNVPDVFRYRTILNAEKYDGAWLSDTLDWTGLLTPNGTTTTAITYAENQAGFTAKRFTVDIGASWNRSNLIAIQAAYSGGQPAFVWKVERSVNNSTWTTIFDSTVSGNVGLAYVLQTDAADNRYFRFTVTLASSLGVGAALAFSKLIGFGARINGGTSLQPFSTDYSRNTIFNGHVQFSSGKYLQGQDGGQAGPSISFANETNMGLFRSGAGILGVATAGVQRARFLSTGLEVFNLTGPQIRLSGQSTNGGGVYIACVDEGDPTNEGYIAFGAEGTHSGNVVTSWIARQGVSAAGSAGILHCDNGIFTFYSNTTGLTAGSTFTPTTIFQLSAASSTFNTSLTANSTLSVVGAATFSNELIGWDAYSAIHNGTVDTFWEATQRLQAFVDTSSTTCMELEVMTPAAGYGGVARITRWQINTRGAIYVSRYEENGGAGNCTLRILSDNSKANSVGVRDRFVVGVTFSDTYQMAYMRVRYTNGTNGRWSTLTAKATSTPTTVGGSSMTYSTGWIANTGYTVEAFTENIVNAKFGTLNLTGTLTGVAASLSGTLTGVAATLTGTLTGVAANLSGTLTGVAATFSGDLTVRSTALVVGSRGTSLTSSIASGVSANEGGLRLITQMTANDSGFHKIGIWNEYNLSGSGHTTQRTAIWNTVSASSADTFSNVVGQYMYFNVGNASGVVTTYSAFAIGAPAATGTITTHVGLNLADITSANVGKAVGIYSAMGSTGGSSRYFIHHAGVAVSLFNGLITSQDTSGSTAAFATKITGNSNNSIELTAGGVLSFGSGSTSLDTNLYRLSANFLATDDSLYVANDLGVGVTAPQGKLHVNGRIHLSEQATNPTAASLTSDVVYNYLDRVAMYVKGDRLVFAYNLAGTVRYISIPLDNTTTTWSTTTP
jgi:hypothetical protein